MGFLSSSFALTRLRIADPVSSETLLQVPFRLKQFAFHSIDDVPEEKAVGWTSFEDMLDTTWSAAPPEKGAYLVFALRVDTRRIPAAVLKKEVQIATANELQRIREQGKTTISRERRQELRDQVKLRLLGRVPAVPVCTDVVWDTGNHTVFLTSISPNTLNLFCEYFERSFEVHLDVQTPYALAQSLVDSETAMQLDTVGLSQFV